MGARLVHELVEADLVPAWLADRPASMRMGVAANLPGLPAVAVPTCGAGWVPQTVHTIGSRIREDFCLTAAVVEAAVPPLTPVERW
ncbi:hypothetical protein [Microbispora sp. H10836]|uniref:hypothetical protein n=1 Tax=Microbispora sp. H10836 TaxID=2729106 RepID=UPI0014752C00|nr:hypothetical protein [Microbispora sp. H10836]